MLTAPYRLRPTVCFILMALPALARAQAAPTAPNALPTNGTVTNGAVTLHQDASTLRVNQTSDKAIVNWDTFNIGREAAVQFIQPGTNSSILNRVLNGPSDIAGKLTSNGRVYLVNPNGVLFSSSARVDVGSLVVGAGTLSDNSYLAGTPQLATRGRVDNAGTINAALGGSVVLAGAGVGNSGTISAAQGAITLAAGDTVRVNLSDDGLIQAQVTLASAQAAVANSGTLDSAGGQIALAASGTAGGAGGLVIDTGVVRAGAVRTNGGTVSLIGGSVEASGSIDVSSNGADAGNVRMFGDLAAGSVRFDGNIDARGATSGGMVETSAAQVQAGPKARVSTLAANGRHGTWLIDPQDFTIGSAPGDDISGATLSANLNQGDVTIESVTGARADGDGDIFVNDPISWSADTRLTLTAESAIRFASGAILDPRNPNAAARANLVATGNRAGLALNYGSDYFLGENKLTLSGTTPSVMLNRVPYTVINGSTSSDLGTKIRANLAGNYVLGVDVDASDTASTNNNLGWDPLGTDETPFSGQLHGFGHVVSGLTVNRPSTDNVGLIGVLSGRMRDIGILDPNIRGGFTTGALVGRITDDGTALTQHTYVAGGSVTGGGAGGLVGWLGYNRGTGERIVVDSSYTSGVVVNGRYEGNALIGWNDLYSAFSDFGFRNSFYNAEDELYNGRALGAGAVLGNQFKAWLAGGRQLKITDYEASLPYDRQTDTYGLGSVQGLRDLLGFANTSIKLRMTGDLDLAAAPALFLPTFEGQLDGANHTIANFVLESSDRIEYSGLIGINKGIIKNLNLANVRIDGQVVGGIAGANYGTIQNSAVGGTVSGTRVAGGLVGLQVGGALLDSLSTATITGAQYAGGVTGSLGGGTFRNTYYNTDAVLINGVSRLSPGGLRGAQYTDWVAGGRSLDIANYASVLPRDPASGAYLVSNVAGVNAMLGFIGDRGRTFRLNADIDLTSAPGLYLPVLMGTLDGNGHQISNLNLNLPQQVGVGMIGMNYGTVRNLGVTNASVSGLNQVGGLVGYNQRGARIETSFSSGTVTSEYATGGLTGINQGDISNSYSRASVVVRTDDEFYDGQYAGGLVGINYGNISNSLATGPVSGGIGSGGLTGTGNGGDGVYGTVTNSFWNIDTTGLSTSGGGTGKTRTELQSVATFTGWDFNNTWRMTDSGPVLRPFAVGLYSLVIDALDLRRIYGAGPISAQDLSLSVSGLQGSDTLADLIGQLSYTGDGIGAINAGSYSVLPGGFSSSKYDIVYLPGTVTIDKAPLALTAANKNKVYGDADPALSFSASGLQYADTAAAASGVVLSAPTGAAAVAGQHAISISGGSAANYTIESYTPGQLTVAKRALALTADSKNKVYGDPDPALSFSASGLQYADTAAAVSGVVLGAPTGAAAVAGQHAISISGGSAANYTVASYASGVLTVAKRPLALTADNKSKVYGDADPALSFSAAGLQYADTVGVLSGVSLSAPQGPAAGAGTHPIAISGGSAANYTVETRNPGVLTVARRPLLLTADNKTFPLNGAPVELTYSASGFAYTDTIDLVDADFTIQGAVPGSTFPIVLVNADAGPNYAVSTVDGIATAASAAEEPVPVQSLLQAPVALVLPRVPDATAASSVALAANIAGGATPQRKELFVQAGNAITRDPSIGSLKTCGENELGDCIARPRVASQAKVSEDMGSAAPTMHIKRKLALVIGNNDYHSPLSRLEGAGRDAKAVASLLRQQGYEVDQLLDADRPAMIKSLNRLIRTTEPDDSVLVFYAGHGYIHPGSSVGYWIPTGANIDDPRGWLSNIDIARFLANMSARQLLLVSDSCFSGALTREGIAEEQPSGMSRNAILMRRSVVALSSGGEEVVADAALDGHSPFTYHLLRQLEAAKGEIPARDMLLSIRDKVSKSSAGQVPSYGIIMSSGHASGGEYLLNPTTN